jgi:hypothetical protein
LSSRLRRTKIVIASRGKDRGRRSAVYAKLRRAKEVGDQKTEEKHNFNRVPRGKDFGIIAELYFDLDFDEVFYLTDKGRKI